MPKGSVKKTATKEQAGNQSLKFKLADRLIKLKDKKEELTQMLKNINAELDTVNEMLTNEMINEECQRFTQNNITYYLKTDYFASIIADESSQKQLFDNLREEGYGDIIRETIHAQTLKAFVKEQITSSVDGELPEFMQGLVNIYTKDKVNTRKG